MSTPERERIWAEVCEREAGYLQQTQPETAATLRNIAQEMRQEATPVKDPAKAVALLRRWQEEDALLPEALGRILGLLAGYGVYTDHLKRAEKQALADDLVALLHQEATPEPSSLEAAREALREVAERERLTVPGQYDGRLSDGTTPHCGLCEAKERMLQDQKTELFDLHNALMEQMTRAEKAEKDAQSLRATLARALSIVDPDY